MRASLARLSAVALFGLVLSPSIAQADDLKAKTEAGKVMGALTPDGKVVEYKGIPYAAPPVGDLRWKAPQPAVKWKGVRTAAQFGNHCMQASAFADMTFRDPSESEDCLTLNVWAPVKAKKLPVMVWIYGGGFQGGGTSENRQDGQFLAHRGVLVVSMNYRLGIWGFMVHPELTAESPQHASGNYGLMDQAAALAWVKKNIASFGGDPNNVTLFGESAGSMSVSIQMASPISKGLFQKAIGESGGSLYASAPLYPTREAREVADPAYAEKAFGTSKLADLRKLSTAQLKTAVMDKSIPGRFWPDIDGYFIPSSIAGIYKAGAQAHIPLIAGWNADEGGVASKATADTAGANAETLFPGKAKEFLAVYPATDDAEAKLSGNAFAGGQVHPVRHLALA